MYKNIIEAYLPKYEPDIWNSDTNIRQSHNCYSYSLNDKYNQLGDLYEKEDEMGKKTLNAQPGQYCGRSDRVIYELTKCDEFIERVLCDNDSVTYKGTDNNFTCGDNYYKIALAINPGKTYHFYRQDKGDNNELWSHKDGGGKATNKDYSGNLIYDPKDADRRYTKDDSYSDFCGYFCVPSNKLIRTNTSRYDPTSNEYVWKSDYF